MISNYIVIQAKTIYRPVRGEYVINLHRTTEVKQINDMPTIPRHKFQMTMFEEARKRIGDITNLMGNFI